MLCRTEVKSYFESKAVLSYNNKDLQYNCITAGCSESGSFEISQLAILQGPAKRLSLQYLVCSKLSREHSGKEIHGDF